MMEDLSLHILDIAENAIAAGATRIALTVIENERRDLLKIEVSDNGLGMSQRTVRRALDPFFSTKGKRTGLGLPLLAQAAEQCGGGVAILTAAGKGTKVTARFRYGHIDRPPLTNMKETLMALVIGHAEIEVLYRHDRNGRIYRFRSRRFLGPSAALAGLDPDSIGRIARDLKSGLHKIGRT
jgi:Histidine kinase-, DNA gyrase B-, and HSP90-like ATPase